MKLLLTFSFVFQLLGVACFAPCLFFLLLTLATFVEVLNNDTNKHIENKKPDQKQERNEVDKTPLIVIESWLQKEKKEKPVNIYYLYLLKSTSDSYKNSQMQRHYIQIGYAASMYDRRKPHKVSNNKSTQRTFKHEICVKITNIEFLGQHNYFQLTIYFK